MPVPSVVTMTSPARPRAAPYRTSARPAASASLTTWTSRPVASVNSASASVPIQRVVDVGRRADHAVPDDAGHGDPDRAGRLGELGQQLDAAPPRPPSGSMAAASAIRARSAAKSPRSRSTGAPLMPLPPKSMPKGRSMGARYPPTIVPAGVRSLRPHRPVHLGVVALRTPVQAGGCLRVRCATHESRPTSWSACCVEPRLTSMAPRPLTPPGPERCVDRPAAEPRLSRRAAPAQSLAECSTSSRSRTTSSRARLAEHPRRRADIAPVRRRVRALQVDDDESVILPRRVHPPTRLVDG